MDFSREKIKDILEDIEYSDTRNANRRAYSFRVAAAFLFLTVCIVGVSFAFGAVVGIVENSPDVQALSFSPVGYASRTVDIQGNQTATLVKAGANREEAKYEDLPENLINAFIAIEDQRFWEHNGIDIRSITRAVRGVLTGNSSQGGGSTITQQLIKNNVFNGGMETGFALYERKFQEWYIALSLENQPGQSKKEIKKQILENYLNTINLGSNSLGVKVAARKYFGKELSELDLAECTVLASITKNPSRLNPLTHPEENQTRRLQVLKNMVSQGYITESQAAAAKSTAVYDEIREVNEARSTGSSEVYSWFTDELISQCIEAFRTELGMTEAQARNLLYSGGLTIYTTQDPDIQKIVDEEVNNPENYDTAKYSLRWTVTARHSDGSSDTYTQRDVSEWMKQKEAGFNGLYETAEKAEKAVEEFRSLVIGETDEAESENLELTLEPQVSVVILDQKTGDVKAISGGRGEKLYSLTTNRATGTYRQPGSVFKVLTAFAPALESGSTLGSVYYDSVYQIAEKEFRNWWRYGQYFGWSSIREGIEFSMNVVAVRCLVETVSPECGMDFAEKLGISTLTEEDCSAALALGGLTNGVSNLELSSAFSSIANGGEYVPYRFFTKICDHEGNVLIDRTVESGVRVMKESTAWLLTDALRMSTVAHTKFSSDFTVNNTSSRAHLDNMVCAGKSGTTTSNRDVWFVGFTPYYTAGIWAGCDENQSLNDSSTGEYNGGTSFHKDIWNKIMTRVHEGLTDPGSFEQPDSIVTAEICRKSGLLASDGCRQDVRNGVSCVYTEYFDADCCPTEVCSHHDEEGSLLIPEEELARGETDDTRVNEALAAQKALEAAEELIGPGDGTEIDVSGGPGTVPPGYSAPETAVQAENYD